MVQYVEQLMGFLQYGLATLFILVVLAIVGSSSLVFCRIAHVNENDDVILLTPAIGAAILSLPLVFIAHHGVAISGGIVWLVIAGLCSPLIYSRAQKLRDNQISLPRLRTIFRSWSVFPFAAAVGLMPYLQLMIKNGFPVGFGTSAMWTNNDLGAYIQMATNVSRSGVRDAGLVTGWNAGLQASFDHPSAHTFFAGISRILNRQPYQVGIVLMATVLGMILLSSTFVIRRLTKCRRFSILPTTVLVVMNPPVIAAACNFFYPQLFSLSIVIGYLGLALVVCRNLQKDFGPVLLSAISLAVLLISVEMAAIFIPLVTFFAVLTTSMKTWKKITFRFVGAYLAIYGLFIVLERDLFKTQFEILTKLSGSGVAGWKSNYVSPSMIFGLVPNQYSGPYSGGTRLIDLLILFTIVILCVVTIVRKKISALIALSLFSLIGLVAIAIRKWGIDGYQTWKLITSFTPLFMILLLCVLLTIKNKENSVSAIAVAMFTIGATFSWTGAIWREVEDSAYINQNLAQILNLEKTSSQTGLNVMLAPYFETMASSVISGAPTRMASPSYYFGEGQPILYRCTVTTVDKLPYLQNHGKIEAQRGKYILVGTPACD